MFGLSGFVFRFGNVVGAAPDARSGLRLPSPVVERPGTSSDPGDGRQSKSYVHVTDVVDGGSAGRGPVVRPVATYNVATGDYITVAEIAQLAVE